MEGPEVVEQSKHDGHMEQGSHLDGKLTPLLFQEGFSIDHAGNQILTWHLDFRVLDKRSPIGAVIKYGHEKSAIERSHTVKLAKPPHYRKEGETLINDQSEGLAIKETVVRREVSVSAVEDVNRALELSGERGTSISTALKDRTVTDTDRDWLEWGNDMWLFSTTMEPMSEDEEKALLESLDPGYDHASYIPSSRTFAQMLGRAYVEQYGAPREPKKPMEHTISGVFVGKTYHRQIVVVHGPVVYVDDPYATCASAVAGQNLLIRMLLPIFVKRKGYSGQREYRFVIPDKRLHEADCKIMPATPELLTAIGRRGNGKGPMSVPDFDTTGAETVPLSETTGSHHIPNPPKLSITRADLAEMNLASSAIDDRFRSVNEAEPTNDFHETVGLYPAVATLHEKIDGTGMGILAAQPERKPYLTSAAWYAERSIRKLCHRFENPIAGISVTEDNSIVIDIRLSHWRDSECKLTVMPSGVFALTLKRKNGESTASHYSFPMMGDHDMATSLDERALDTIADYEPQAALGH